MIYSEWTRRRFLNTGFMSTLGMMGMGIKFEKLFSASEGVEKLPGGFWPVMMTPYHEDLSIDYQGLKRLIRWYEEAGAQGFFANCGSSEMFKLSGQERIDLTRFIVNHSNVPVVSTGTFYDTQEANIDFIRKIHETGVDAVVIIPSILVGKEVPDPDLLKYFRDIADQAEDIPLGIYESPGPYHRLISTEMLVQLKDTGRFSYFKDTSCDADVVEEKIQIVSNSAVGIYNAHSPDVLHSIRHGGAGISCIAGNYYPELFSYLWAHGREKTISESVEKVNEFILAKDSAIGRKYKLSAKYFMNLRGLDIKVNSRETSQVLDASDKEWLDSLWEELQVLSDEVGVDMVTYL